MIILESGYRAPLVPPPVGMNTVLDQVMLMETFGKTGHGGLTELEDFYLSIAILLVDR
jgi:hypothetical protein